jgi:hypothetical protein
VVVVGGCACTVASASHSSAVHGASEFVAFMSKPVVISYFLVVGILVALCIAVFFFIEQTYPGFIQGRMAETELLEEGVIADDASPKSASPTSPTDSSPKSLPPPKSTPPLNPLEASPGEQVANGIKCPCTDDCGGNSSADGEIGTLDIPPTGLSENEAGCNAPSLFCKQMHGVLHGVAAGVVGAQSLVFGKASAEMITGQATGDSKEGLDIPVLLFCLVFMILTLVLQLVTLNRGLRYHATLLVVPVYQTFWTLTGILGAAICFNEFAEHSLAETLGFAAGAVSMLAGLWCLVRAQEEPTAEVPDGVVNVTVSGVAPSPDGQHEATKHHAQFEVQIENTHATKGG